MSSTRQIVVRLALYFHLFSVPHPTIALYGSEILESPHTATSGLSDEHDATAAVSTIGKSKIQHPSLICRRYLGGCLTRGSHSSGVTETSAERNKAKIKKLKEKAMWIIPVVRDDWNMEQAKCEENLVGAIHLAKTWVNHDSLAEGLWDLSLLRKRTTRHYGGFSEEVLSYIRDQRLPAHYRQFNSQLQSEIQSIKDNPHTFRPRERELKMDILNKIVDVELQDNSFKPHMMETRLRLDELNQSVQWVLRAHTGLPQVSHVRPSFPIGRRLLKPTPPRTHLKWMRLQLELEKNHYDYLQEVNSPNLDTWNDVGISVHDFFTHASPQSVQEGELFPQHFTKADYIRLEKVELSRRLLIKRTAISARPEAWNIRLPDHLPPEIRESRIREIVLKRQLGLETFVIQSISEPHSREALRCLQLIESHIRTSGVQPYVRIASRFQEPSFPPPPYLMAILQMLRPERSPPQNLPTPNPNLLEPPPTPTSPELSRGSTLAVPFVRSGRDLPPTHLPLRYPRKENEVEEDYRSIFRFYPGFGGDSDEEHLVDFSGKDNFDDLSKEDPFKYTLSSTGGSKTSLTVPKEISFSPAPSESRSNSNFEQGRVRSADRSQEVAWSIDLLDSRWRREDEERIGRAWLNRDRLLKEHLEEEEAFRQEVETSRERNLARQEESRAVQELSTQAAHRLLEARYNPEAKPKTKEIGSRLKSQETEALARVLDVPFTFD